MKMIVNKIMWLQSGETVLLLFISQRSEKIGGEGKDWALIKDNDDERWHFGTMCMRFSA